MTAFIMCYTASAADAPSSGLMQVDKTEKVTITWAVNPAPPFYVLEGKYKSQGICDVLIDKIIPQMNKFNHTKAIMPQARVNLQSERDENICFPCVIKRKDDPTWRFSNATTVHPPLGIIALPETVKPYLDSDGRVSLAELINSTAFTFAKPVSRKYPDKLQILVKQLEQTSRFETIAGADSTTRILSQLMYGRIDFTLEYPSILKYFTLTGGPSKLQYYYTTELGETPIPGAVGCTNNAWGENVIEHVNEALKSIVDTPDYRASQGVWLSP